MYCGFVNNTLRDFCKRQKVLKYLFSAVIISSVLSLPNLSYAASSDVFSSKKIDALFDSRDLYNLIKNNKAEVLKQGRSKLVIDSKKLDLYKEDLQTHAVDVIDRLQLNGYKAYLVGGAVRDLLAGKNPKDYDVCTNATVDELISIFKSGRKIGKNYPIVRLEYDDEQIEIASFSRPNAKNASALGTKSFNSKDAQSASLLALDSDRRDLTINAIYFDINNEQLIDFHGGIYDLKARVINTIGDASTIYKQDPIRMLRVLRFAAKLNFKISSHASAPIEELAPILLQVHPMRVFSEVNKLFLSGHSVETLKLLNDYAMLKYLFPPLEDMNVMADCADYLEDVVELLDDEFAHGILVKPYVLYAYMIWPAFIDKFNYLKEEFTEYTDEQLTDWASSRVLTEQSRATALRNSLPDEMTTLWKMQLRMLNTKDMHNVIALSSDPRFIHAFELLRLRSSYDKNLKRTLKFWQPYYDEKIMFYSN